MLIMKYNGGLGNQMFQFAAAATLAVKLGVEFGFDMSFFSHSYARAYQMDIFQFDSRESHDLRAVLYWPFRRVFKSTSFLGLNIYKENSFNYEERFESIKNDTFIEGFFQSAKYIDEALIKKYFTFKTPPSGQNLSIISSMMEQNCVSLHIRRGDYVSKKRYANIYNHLELSHYEAAMEYMSQLLKDPVFYIFSDDIDWARENLNFNNCPICRDKTARLEFVSHNCGSNSWEDLRLMSHCKHNIIANSSFSYWGAYLGDNKDKIVIAPEKWFADPNKTTIDTYPKNWILL